MSGTLERGDEILRVDGFEVQTVDDLHIRLKGSDLPCSSVVLTVKQRGKVLLMLPACQV